MHYDVPISIRNIQIWDIIEQYVIIIHLVI